MRQRCWLLVVCLLASACAMNEPASTTATSKSESSPHTLRVATFNVSFFAHEAGTLEHSLRARDPDKLKVAEVIRQVRPDIMLLNEFDYEHEPTAVALFLELLREPGDDQAGIDYSHWYRAEVNTGIQSGLDLDHDGRVGSPADAWGFGAYPGQYGMLLLSRYPIDAKAVRSFQHFRWSQMPGALRPGTTDASFYPDAIWSQLRLSSKSHWDVPVQTPLGALHVLAMHPTPPVFDGPEDRHGRRNHDEIRLFADYIDPQRATYLIDDQGRRGAIADDGGFVILGDLNADPADGESRPGAIAQLLQHPRINGGFVPRSPGARAKALADGAPNAEHRGDPAADTGDFFEPASGNLRIDYVLPSSEFEVLDGGVFWPAPDSPDGDLASASDHHMVWLDLRLR
jgi:endonuclease/exonuclease/phosphatase family metal-dependent hydrolase